MKVIVEFTDATHTSARIYIVPGLMARLFGARTKMGNAERIGSVHYESWVWIATRRAVGGNVMRALELQDVEPLPRASTAKRDIAHRLTHEAGK